MDRRTVRRLYVAPLVLAGALLLWVAPETPAGLLMLAGGLALEAIGIRLDHA